MGRGLGYRLFPFKIIPVFASFRLFAGDDLRAKDSPGGKEVPQRSPGRRVFADPLGDDVPGAGQGLLGGGYGFFRIDKGSRLSQGILLFLGEKDVGQGFQASFPGHRGPGAALRPEGEVNIFQDGHGLRSQDLFLQIIGEELPLLQGI